MLEFTTSAYPATRAPALTGRYQSLSFHDAAGGRAWLGGILDTVQSAAAMEASVSEHKSWVTVAFTWSGLRALGVDDVSEYVPRGV